MKARKESAVAGLLATEAVGSMAVCKGGDDRKLIDG